MTMLKIGADMQTIYIEKSILNHPRTQRILKQVGAGAHIIECNHYQEVFNPRAQNFRIQKQLPALILAEKQGKKVMPAPPGFGIGGQQNFYFSHMLNCLYDCRYCFLQGMYSSAHYVLFVNYEDFMAEIKSIADAATSPIYFFSGYDCDSLAYEPVTHFVKEFLPFFKKLNNAVLELRTKSTNVKELLAHDPFDHCVAAFSFTPEEISKEVENKVPAVEKRLQAIQKVAEQGWPIGLRFDPLIHHADFKMIYEKLIDDIFSKIHPNAVHSISLGPLRFPEKMYQKIVKLYPQDKLLAQQLHRKDKMVSYGDELEKSMKDWIHQVLKKYVKQAVLFECVSS